MTIQLFKNEFKTVRLTVFFSFFSSLFYKNAINMQEQNANNFF